MIFKLEQNDVFIAFVDHFTDYAHAIVTVLVSNSEEGLLLRNYTYNHPFRKQDFASQDDSVWTYSSEPLSVSQEIAEILTNSQINVRKVSLIERENEDDREDSTIYRGLMI